MMLLKHFYWYTTRSLSELDVDQTNSGKGRKSAQFTTCRPDCFTCSPVGRSIELGSAVQV